jgi:hypothetical protein
MTPFREFVAMYNDGSIVNDAAWRAYDIEKMVTPQHVLGAASRMHVKYLGRTVAHIVPTVAAEYGLSSPTRAAHLMGLWYVWANIACGRRKTRLILREGNEKPAGR